MVPARNKQGHFSKGKGASSSKTSNVKSKDVKKEKPAENETEETPTEETIALPDLKLIHTAKQMPRFLAILNGPEEPGVTMEDLDPLQMELELLLNAVVVRSVNLHAELTEINSAADSRKASSGRGPSSPGKRIKSDEKSPKKLKDAMGKPREVQTPLSLKLAKLKQTPKAEPEVDELPPLEPVPTTTQKNDVPNRFWSSIEPYCSDFQEEDLKFIEELISSHNDDEEYMKVPPLGRHYTLRWAEEDLQQEQRESCHFGDKKRAINAGTVSSSEAQRLMDSASKLSEPHSGTTPLCGPLTQRLVSALMEENIVTSLQDAMDEGVQDENSALVATKVSMTGSQVAALEQRIRQELEEQGILAADEANVAQADDEILTDLRRCQGELKSLAEHNLQQLRKLHKRAQDEMKRQELKRKLSAIDAEIVDNYRKAATARQKKRPLSKKEKDQIWKVIRERENILKQLDTL